MQRLKQLVATPENWNEAVQMLWRVKRTTLLLNLYVIALTVVTTAIVWFTAAILISALNNIAVPIFLILIILYITGVIACLCIYLLEWLFYVNIKRWQGVAPAEFKSGIKSFSTYILIFLIATPLVYFLEKFTHTHYITYIASAIQLPVIIAIIASEIGKFTAIMKLRRVAEMPSIAKRGLSHIFYSYILKYGSYAVGIIFLFMSLIVMSFDKDIKYEQFGQHGEIYANAVWANNSQNDEASKHLTQYYGYGWYIDKFSDIFDHKLSEIDDILDGLMHCVREDFEEAADEIADNDAITFLSLTGVIIIAMGAILAFAIYYRGWWLISKSEIDTLPEPTPDSHEEVACTDIIEMKDDTSNATIE